MFIRLIDHNDKPILVGVYTIIYVMSQSSPDTQSYIKLTDGCYLYVKDSVDEIYDMVRGVKPPPLAPALDI